MRRSTDDALENVSYYATEPAAKTLEGGRMPEMEGVSSALGAGLGLFSQGLDAFKNLKTLPGFVSKGRKTIAGRSAVCATWSPSYAQGTVEQCLDLGTGAVLFWAADSPGGPTRIQAIEVGAPSNRDFTPTHPVTELPRS
ncbi:MAG: hypothetical protein WDA27_02190 [Actinomycetota bacterium]